LTPVRSLALLLPLVLLAACGKSSDGNDRRSASGEVLPGTTSDAMLPLDKLKSQPPLLAPSAAKSTPEGLADEASGADEATTEAPAAPDAEAVPAPTPAPSPSSSSQRTAAGPQG
jgi:hypothetical protein